MRKILLCQMLVLFAAEFAWSGMKAAPQVLIYRGKGACLGCSTAPGQIAKNLGYTIKYVREESSELPVLSQSKIWIQPGGDAIEMAHIFNSLKMENLRTFVKNGGSYIGFCAGAFFADTTVDDAETIKGLGILPGVTYDFVKDQAPLVLPIKWQGQVRQMYYQGGPAFKLSIPSDPLISDIEVIATYPDGAAAAVRFKYGLGKVFLTGPHPEASEKWLEEDNLQDSDGLDNHLVAEMLNWVLPR